jgi:arylsulfatase A-like enzyme
MGGPLLALLATAAHLGCVDAPARAQAPATPAAVAPAAKRPPNIVLVSMDGLRWDRTHLGGNPRATTPSLDALAKEGATFVNSLSTSNESLFSHAAMFTGRYPSELGTPDYLEFLMPQDATTLAEALGAVGYDTAAFTSGGHIKGTFGFAQGFSRYFEGQDFGSFRDTVPEASAWIAERPGDRPWFVFLHGYDCHRPYLHESVFWHPFHDGGADRIDELLLQRNFSESIYKGVYYPKYRHAWAMHANGERILDPDLYREIPDYAAKAAPDERDPLSQAEQDHILAHYDGAVLEADTYVGMFLDALAARPGGLSDTLVIVTSDHGEDLATHGYYNHRAITFDSTTRVPMVLAGAIPASARGATRTELVDALDVVATAMDAAGSVPPAGSHGVSLLGVLAGTATAKDVVYQHGVMGQLSARTARWRLVFEGGDLREADAMARLMESPLAAPTWTLFDVAADPGEQVDVLAAHPDEAKALRAGMVQWWARLPRGTASQALSPETEAMLRRNGYW